MQFGRPPTLVLLGFVGLLIAPAWLFTGTQVAVTPESGVQSASTSPSPADPGGVALDTGVGLLSHRLATVGLKSAGPAGLYTTPVWLAYDRVDHAFFVAVTPSSVDVVTIDSRGVPNVTAILPVGEDPFGVAYDNFSDRVYVTNSGSANVSVLSYNQSTPVASVSVGICPLGIAFDPVNRDIYVANNGSDNVSVISTSTGRVIASVPVGSDPIGVAADPLTGDVFVADHGSSNVSVLSGSTNAVVATIPVPNGPYGVAVDNATASVYVTDEGADAVSVISARTLRAITNISVEVYVGPEDLQGIAYDWGDNLVWVGAGWSMLVAIDPSALNVAGQLTVDPSGVAYDPDNGDLCVTNTANRTFACLTNPGGPGLTKTYGVHFSEAGLPAGTNWSVGFYGATGQSDGPLISFVAPNGSYPFSVAQVGAYAPSPASGTVTVYGSDATVAIAFSGPTTYLLTFRESGLPAGYPFRAWLDGQGREGTSSVSFSEPNGTYTFSVENVSGYSPTPSAGIVTVGGSDVTVNVTFRASPSPRLYAVTFHETGLPSSTPWGVAIGSQVRQSVTDTVLFREMNGTYGYAVLPVAGYVTNYSGVAEVAGADILVPVAFQIRLYSVVISEYGLPQGVNWSATVANASTGFFETASSQNGTVAFSLPNGTYEVTFGLPPGYVGYPSATEITVAGEGAWGVIVNVIGPEGSVISASLSPWQLTFAIAGPTAVAAGLIAWTILRRRILARR